MLPEIKITKTENPKAKFTDESSLGFGKVFTDHMFIVEYTEGKGWHDARIEPYHNFSIDPAATVLHYGQEIFEGLKAYRRDDGHIQLFRPEENAMRMNNSAERVCMPTLDVEYQVKAMKMLVEIEKDWVPHKSGTSLYLRPTMIGLGNALGVHPAKHYYYYIICAASGSYYKNGMAPIKIHIEDSYVRAVKGGTGFTKCGGNYAASTRAGERAAKKGYSQVLWLDGVERKYVEEVGTMNVMFVINGEVVTPALTGSILRGISRDSAIMVLREKGYKVREEEYYDVSIDIN